ncbi:MAG: DUF6524 family protein [Shimia sp.]
MGFLFRWLFAFLLVALTYNPTPYNYVAWGVRNWRLWQETPEEARLSFVALAGLVLLVGYIIYLRATLRSIGVIGMVLVLAMVGACLWVASDLGWLSLANRTANMWIGIVALSFMLGIGMSWSIVRRMLTGQSDMDDVSE